MVLDVPMFLPLEPWSSLHVVSSEKRGILELPIVIQKCDERV
jgi:hypothetical protein